MQTEDIGVQFHRGEILFLCSHHIPSVLPNTEGLFCVTNFNQFYHDNFKKMLQRHHNRQLQWNYGCSEDVWWKAVTIRKDW
jgi:hypothetical protein